MAIDPWCSLAGCYVTPICTFGIDGIFPMYLSLSRFPSSYRDTSHVELGTNLMMSSFKKMISLFIFVCAGSLLLHGLFSSCGKWASLLCSMWDLPRLGIWTCVSCIDKQILYHEATREAPWLHLNLTKSANTLCINKSYSQVPVLRILSRLFGDTVQLIISVLLRYHSHVL